MSGVEWNTGQPQPSAKPRLISVRRISEARQSSSPTVKYDHSSRAMCARGSRTSEPCAISAIE